MYFFIIPAAVVEQEADNITALEISQGDYISATADPFLMDRQARELSRSPLLMRISVQTE
jgi:hypothetical protein